MTCVKHISSHNRNSLTAEQSNPMSAAKGTSMSPWQLAEAGVTLTSATGILARAVQGSDVAFRFRICSGCAAECGPLQGRTG